MNPDEELKGSAWRARGAATSRLRAIAGPTDRDSRSAAPRADRRASARGVRGSLAYGLFGPLEKSPRAPLLYRARERERPRWKNAAANAAVTAPTMAQRTGIVCPLSVMERGSCALSERPMNAPAN